MSMKSKLLVFAGVCIALAVFIVVVLAAWFVLKWPNDPVSLMLVVGVAFVASAQAGRKVSESHIPVGLAVAVAATLAVGSFGWGEPWRVGQPFFGQISAAAEENVIFQVDGYFWYRGSENNAPIDNVILQFPQPQIDNEFINSNMGWWTFFYVDDNGNWLMEMQGSAYENYGAVYQFYGERTQEPVLVSAINMATPFGPKADYIFDRIYPREAVWVTFNTMVPKENASKVTLVEVDITENQLTRTTAYYWQSPTVVDLIDLTFWVKLSKLDNNTLIQLENYSRVFDNAPSGGYYGLW